MDAIQPAIGMAIDRRRPSAVRDDVTNGDVADHAGGWFVGALRPIHLAAALDIEMNRIAIAPPEPIEARSLDGDVGDYDVFHDAAVEHHKRQSSIGVCDDNVVYGHAPHCVRIAIAKLDRAR